MQCLDCIFFTEKWVSPPAPNGLGWYCTIRDKQITSKIAENLEINPCIYYGTNPTSHILDLVDPLPDSNKPRKLILI